jgi:hypothetical protein
LLFITLEVLLVLRLLLVPLLLLRVLVLVPLAMVQSLEGLLERIEILRLHLRLHLRLEYRLLLGLVHLDFRRNLDLQF